MKSMQGVSANRIFMHIIRDQLGNVREYTYIILGRPGKTGKTWLCNELRAHGYNAFEISEEVCNLVKYVDEDNYCAVNEFEKQVVIVLNRFI